MMAAKRRMTAEQHIADWKLRWALKDPLARILIPGVAVRLIAMRPDVLRKKSTADIAALIFAERKRRGLSANQAAESVRVSEETFGGWESGTNRPQGDEEGNVCVFLGKGLKSPQQCTSAK